MMIAEQKKIQAKFSFYKMIKKKLIIYRRRLNILLERTRGSKPETTFSMIKNLYKSNFESNQ